MNLTQYCYIEQRLGLNFTHITSYTYDTYKKLFTNIVALCLAEASKFRQILYRRATKHKVNTNNK